MLGIKEVIHAWSRAGNLTPNDRLGRYAQALVDHGQIGPYRVLDDYQEDRAILALYRVDRRHATIADLHQRPPLALTSYYQLLHDLAHEGIGLLESSQGVARGLQ